MKNKKMATKVITFLLIASFLLSSIITVVNAF